MKYNRLSFLSVFIALGVSPVICDAAIRVGNAARNNAQGYQQVNTQRYQSDYNTQNQIQEQRSLDLPINVANQQLAQQIQNGDANAGVTIDDLERCSMIYPNGEFEWARPTIGMQAGGAPTCTAVVELRALVPNNGQEYTLLARANLAAGDSFECNVSNFPMSSLFNEVETVSFPADKEPEVADVVAVMNEEQKQNAAIKIIGGAILGGLGGNAFGENEVGKDGILGGGKDKIVSTIVGSVGGAGLMAASTYSGKVAGDMILSTGVNATAGAVIGNMVTDGDSVVRIEKCKVDGVEQTCLWGYVEKKATTTDNADKLIFVQVDNYERFMICDKERKNCSIGAVGGGQVAGYENRTDLPNIAAVYKIKNWSSGVGVDKYCLSGQEMRANSAFAECSEDSKKSNQYVAVKGGSIIESRVPAMIVGVDDSAFGYNKKTWDDLKREQDLGSKKIVGRTGQGEATVLEAELATLNNFKPMYLSAEDGGVIDLDNKARLKGTLTGAGVGGAAGAFTAYQGAQTEIDARYVAAVREYKDSLQKFYCGTGQRFLSFYNDATVIPRQN
ncbi:MAG: hypothetical protein ACLRFK_03650 [Alphaproteobacteria bacterium]